jgi:hypothetical protein
MTTGNADQRLGPANVRQEKESIVGSHARRPGELRLASGWVLLRMPLPVGFQKNSAA